MGFTLHFGNLRLIVPSERSYVPLRAGTCDAVNLVSTHVRSTDKSGNVDSSLCGLRAAEIRHWCFQIERENEVNSCVS